MGYQQRDYVDTDAIFDRFVQQQHRDAKVDADCVDIAKHAAILRQRAADEAAAVQLMSTSRRADGYRQFVDVLAQRHRFTVHVTRQHGDRASANCRRREIHIGPLIGLLDFITALHEVGHVIEGVCPEREPHRHESVDGFSNCQECERLAWERGLALCPVPFTRDMHARMAYCLRTYRSTPAPAMVVRANDRLASSTGYVETCTNRWRQETFRQKQQLVDASLRQQRQQWGSR